MQPTTRELQEVLTAARQVLDARADQMLTSEEWDRLARAVAACSKAARGRLVHKKGGQ